MRKQRLRSLLYASSAGAALALTVALPARARDGAGPEHAQRGRVAYDLRDWATAAHEFRNAYEAEPRPEYLFGLAQALRQSRDHEGAIFTFKAYKRLEGVTAQQATAAELLIAQCEAEQTKAETEASIAARALPPTPNTQPAATPAQPQPFAAPAPALAERRLPDDEPFYADAFGDVLFLAGLGAAGVGTALLLGGNTDMKASASEPTESRAAEAADDAHGKQVLGGVLLPVGGALVAGAVWRWMSLGPDTEEAPQGISIGPACVTYRGRF